MISVTVAALIMQWGFGFSLGMGMGIAIARPEESRMTTAGLVIAIFGVVLFTLVAYAGRGIGLWS